MKDITNKQIARQDFVDNSIFELLRSLNPSDEQIDWNIGMIEEIRSCIAHWLVEQLEVTDEMTFYPYIEE